MLPLPAFPSPNIRHVWGSFITAVRNPLLKNVIIRSEAVNQDKRRKEGVEMLAGAYRHFLFSFP